MVRQVRQNSVRTNSLDPQGFLSIGVIINDECVACGFPIALDSQTCRVCFAVTTSEQKLKAPKVKYVSCLKCEGSAFLDLETNDGIRWCQEDECIVPSKTPIDTTNSERGTKMLEAQKYARKPFHVDAVQVTEANLAEVALWCAGEIVQTEGVSHIKVKVHRALNDRQTKAFVGDWVLYAGTGFKVYMSKAFHSGFEQVDASTTMIPTNKPVAVNPQQAFAARSQVQVPVTFADGTVVAP